MVLLVEIKFSTLLTKLVFADENLAYFQVLIGPVQSCIDFMVIILL